MKNNIYTKRYIAESTPSTTAKMRFSSGKLKYNSIELKIWDLKLTGTPSDKSLSVNTAPKIPAPSPMRQKKQ